MSNENSKSTQVAVLSDVSNVIEQINAKIKGIEKIRDTQWVTSGKIIMAGGSAKDIKTEKEVIELVKAFAGVVARANALEEAYELLGVKEYPVIQVDGATVEQWKQDILLRKAIIEQEDTLKKLNELKKEAEELMDKEDRKKLFLKKLEGFASTI